MPIVQEILAGIPDGSLLDEHPVLPQALRELIKHYNKISWLDNDAAQITDSSTGAQLKAAVEKLPAEKIVVLLYNYISAKKLAAQPEKVAPIPTTTDPVTGELTAEDKAKLRATVLKTLEWVFRGIIFLFVAGIFMAMGGGLYMALNQGAINMDSFGMSEFFSSSIEMFKLISGMRK